MRVAGADRDSIGAYQGTRIRSFLERHADAFRGDVLDYGCGASPYEDIVVQAGARYHPYDRPYFPGGMRGSASLGPADPLRRSWDGILCTQMLQLVPDPWELIDRFARALLPRNGCLVLTYATNWDEVLAEDLMRFTNAGMTRALSAAGFEIEAHERLGVIEIGDFSFPLDNGVVAHPSRRNRARRRSRRRIRRIIEALPRGEHAVYRLRQLEAKGKSAVRR